MLAHVHAVRVLLLDRADRRRRGEQCLHSVLGRHPPERARVRRAHRLALVEHGRRAEHQRPVHDVGVADHPADVGGGPVHVAGMGVVDVAHAPQQRDGVPAVVADDSLRSTGRAGGVEHVERVGGRDGHRSTGCAPAISSCQSRSRPDERLARSLVALHDDAGRRGVLGDVEGGVDHRLVVDGAGRLDAARRGDDGGGTGVVDARGEFVRGEAAEHHRVHGAQPRTRQHRDDGLGNHRHVDHDAVALADAQARAARRRTAPSRRAVRGRCRCAASRSPVSRRSAPAGRRGRPRHGGLAHWRRCSARRRGTSGRTAGSSRRGSAAAHGSTSPPSRRRPRRRWGLRGWR